MNQRSRSTWLAASSLHTVMAGALALSIFVLDTFVALSGEIAVLYVIVVLMIARHLPRRAVIAVAAICGGLAVVAFLAQHGFRWNDALLRCVVSCAAIGVTTFLALRNQAANAQLAEQARLLDLTHDTIFARGLNDGITYWNRGAEELYGWSREQAVGMCSHDLLQTIFPEPRERIMEQLLQAGRWEGELAHIKRDGTQVTVSSRWSLQRDERGHPIAVLETNNDITERKRADAELRASERRYRNIFQTAGVAILEVDNSGAKSAIDELKAQGVADFPRYFAENPDFVRHTLAKLRIIDANDPTAALIGAQSKAEVLASWQKTVLPETEQAFAGVLRAIAARRSTFESETLLKTLRGETRSIFFSITFPPDSDDLKSVLVSIVDVTERNQAQEALHRAQAQLSHVTRVTTLGELAASIAHEVNQPLAAIVTNGEAGLRWLKHEKPNIAEVHNAVSRIVGDANRASAVIRRIRDLARKGEPEKTMLDINVVIDDVIPLVQRAAASHGASLRLDLSSQLPAVQGDRVQLQQVVLNLIVNAIEAMAGVHGRRKEVVIRSRDQAGDIVVEVLDSGIGIDPASAKKVFDAFYTTKREGMGMGLSICRSIVEAHGGGVSARPNTPHGAVFQFTLPVHAEALTH